MIINRYLYKEISTTLIAVSGVLLLILLGTRFIRLIADAVAGIVPGEIIFSLVLLKTISSLTVLLPLCLYIAVLLAFGRWYRDSEMAVLAASGIGLPHLLRSTLFYALFFSLFVALITLYLAPWAEEKSYQIRDQAEAEASVGGINAGKFTEAGGGKLVYYIEQVQQDGKAMKKVFMQQYASDGITIISAPQAHMAKEDSSSAAYIVFENGTRYEGWPGDADFKRITFDEHRVKLTKSNPRSHRKLVALPTAELLNSQSRVHISELQWRLSMPVATVLLAALAVLLSETGPRQGRFAKLFVAILVYILYTNLIGISRAWLEQGTIPPSIGIWWVHGVLLVLILLLAAKKFGLRRYSYKPL